MESEKERDGSERERWTVKKRERDGSEKEKLMRER